MEYLQLEREKGTVILTLNRPQALNAMNKRLVEELRGALDELEADRSLQTLVLTGAGERAFCAGIDIKERARLSPEESVDLRHRLLFPLFSRLEALPVPVIAAVNGAALGGGCELTLASDLRIASERASFGLTEVRWGIIPAGGGLQRLPRIVGLGKAKELILTGRIIDAAEAERIGLVMRVVPPDRLMAEARAVAEVLAQNSAFALRLAKQSLNRVWEIDQGLAFDTVASDLCYAAGDQLQRMQAFGEKGKA
ncbi:MAG: enoyl-CoA hydratase/isomerase family protein [Deltaproteobacteria bacterium]|nr:enoyl-CoA hydratase/isomerase family protein [Deltaproteobacteria bacterium]MBI3078124.1 enoyl-CoA hydratase/isomerase family protein [Deltaproteobacteria bacterium]